jgi:hypothetical protein
VLSRTATDISTFIVDGTTFFWLEASGTNTSLWTQRSGSAPEQLAAGRPGSGEIASDAQFVYVSRSKEGVVLRYPRTGMTAGTEILRSLNTPGPLLLRGPYLLVLSYGSGPDYRDSEVSRCARDGSGCVSLSKDPTVRGLAANATTAFT